MKRPPKYFIGLLTVALLAGAAGCRRAVVVEPPAKAAPAWDWRSFPEASELLLAQLPATVQPARFDLVRAPGSGRLRLEGEFVRGGEVKAGQAWAVLEPDEAAEEAALLGRFERQLDERRERYRHFEQPLAIIRLDRELVEIREALALAQFAERSPELFAGDPPALDPRLKPPGTAAQMQEQLRLLEERRARTAAGEPDSEPADLQGLASEIEQRRHAREARRERLTLKAEFAGLLRLTTDFDGGGRRVNAGDPVATLEDPQLLEVRVVAALPLLHAVRPESLRVVIALPGGGSASGTFAAVGWEMKGDMTVPVMRFRLLVPPGHADTRPPLGVEVLSSIYTELAKPARIVPKLALVQRDPGNALGDGWRAGLANLFPGSELAAEGRQAVAVVPPR